MSEKQTISWIFLAIAIASQKEAASLNGISTIADGINHAIPTQKEMQRSIAWLLSNKLIEKEDSKYKLTKDGMIQHSFASSQTKGILEIWKNIERQFREIV